MRSRMTGRLAITLGALLVGTSVVGAQSPAEAPRGQVRPGAAGGVHDARIGSPIAPILLLTRTDIRRELGLSPEQEAEADRAITGLLARALALKGRTDAEADVERRKIDRDGVAWLTDHLAPEQRRRLDQITLQWEGPSALLRRPFVKEALRLTPEQSEALARAVAERNARRKSGPAIPADEAQLEASFGLLLTEPQRETWREMLGPDCAFRVAVLRAATTRR